MKKKKSKVKSILSKAQKLKLEKQKIAQERKKLSPWERQQSYVRNNKLLIKKAITTTDTPSAHKIYTLVLGDLYELMESAKLAISEEGITIKNKKNPLLNDYISMTKIFFEVLEKQSQVNKKITKITEKEEKEDISKIQQMFEEYMKYKEEKNDLQK